MRVEKFRGLLQRAEYRKNDQKFFPLWVRRYAESVKAERGRVPVTLESVTEFFVLFDADQRGQAFGCQRPSLTPLSTFMGR